ncbi:MAG: LPS export ABC transporter periplasmic protein LptC [Pseudomonadota bacterium]
MSNDTDHRDREGLRGLDAAGKGDVGGDAPLSPKTVAPEAASPKTATPALKAQRALETFSIKQRTTQSDAVARSRLVRRLRVALPGLAVVFVLAFLLTTRSNGVDDAFLKDFTLDMAPEELEMANPRFAGVDGEGKPFEILAADATRAADQEEVVSLTSPRAVTNSEDETTTVVARRGVFQSETKVLDLSEDVVLEHAIGVDNYVLRTSAATVLLDEKQVLTDQGVDGEGPGGNTLKADRMRAYQADGRVVFEGNVKMKIYQSDNLVGAPALRTGEETSPAKNPDIAPEAPSGGRSDGARGSEGGPEDRAQ